MRKGKVQGIRASLRERFAVPPLADNLDALEAWWETPVGRGLLAEEQALIDHALREIYGFHLMQLGINRKLDLTGASTINHRFALAPVMDSRSAPLITGRAEPEQVPLGAESIDLALLHHVLEFSQNPHQLLRETSRVLIPRGYALIIGFNPISWFGAFKQCGRLFGSHPLWRHHSLRVGRVVDWLRLLDFEPLRVDHGFYRWPAGGERTLRRTRWMEHAAQATRLPMGAFYFILARKDIVAMTPIKPDWKRLNPMDGLVGAQPSSRSIQRNSVQRNNTRDEKNFENSGPIHRRCLPR